ncbi:Fe(3+)-hydroxamate ABC transporter permease FhuB [Enterovibrio sp. 27052020O]|uniref:Fe(3+)-hydroxamate ABC transporter permease FhuB n=1 Tax=Enterovibrio sp. 27052020O TaxID=3241166 RepID=UPI00388EA8CE
MTSHIFPSAPSVKRASRPILALTIITSLLSVLLYRSLPYELSSVQWVESLFSPDENDYRQIIIHYSYLPRIAMAMLCGAGLALAGAVMRFVLSNPLASPTTLGVAAGAELGLVLASLFLPASWMISPYIPAFAGGMLATGLVFMLAAKRGYSPLALILAGMVTTLFIGAVTMMLVLVHEQQLTQLFVWGAGALEQQDWQGIKRLVPMIFIASIMLFILVRPLTAMQMGEAIASSIGVNVAALRLIAIALSVMITAAIVSEVGIIGFVGLVAPALAKMLGARRLPAQMAVSALLGAALLLGADLLIQPLSGVAANLIPTGAVTAAIGAPFLLFLLQRKNIGASFHPDDTPAPHVQAIRFSSLTALLVTILVTACAMSLLVGNSQSGWQFTLDPILLGLRVPRVAVAMLAGCCLAIAGTIMQRITQNPMASPEVMGISAGCALALVIGAVYGLYLSRMTQLLLGTAGAIVVVVLILLLGKKRQFSPIHLMLTGIALSAAADAAIRIVMASGDDNVKALLNWLSGSMYLADNLTAFMLMSVTLSAGLAVILCARWLDLFSLGSESASSLGLNLPSARKWMILATGVLTAAATIAIGPLSFVGLLAPHMARSLAQYGAKQQLITAALLGATLLVLADWVGRNLWFPWQFPAGLLASLLGGAYFLYLLQK